MDNSDDNSIKLSHLEGLAAEGLAEFAVFDTGSPNFALTPEHRRP